MSVTTHADGSPSITELRHMSEAEAKAELTVNQYETWKSVQERFDEHEEQKTEYRENTADAASIMIRRDPSAKAVDIELWGNPVSVYYAADDPRLQDAAQTVADVFDVDDADDAEAVDTSTEDLTEEDAATVHAALTDMITAAIIEWDGRAWDDLGDADRDAIREAIRGEPPEGWGVAGAMDAWIDIQIAVERERDERLEVVEKFLDPERRGDR